MYNFTAASEKLLLSFLIKLCNQATSSQIKEQMSSITSKLISLMITD